MSFLAFRSFLLHLRSAIGAIFAVLLLNLLTISPALAANGINRAFNYQGRLFDATGGLVSDGTYTMKFSLYDAPTGGTRLWTAAGTTGVPTTVNVTVTNGLFTVLMGDVSSGQNALNIDWNQDALYLGVTVGADSEMSPRKRLTAVPYSFNSETLQGNYASSSVASTGGNLMSLHQTATDAASADRAALFVQTGGTSNAFDYLFKGNNGASDVFTINRLGNTTTTGNFSVAGATSLNTLTASDTTSTFLSFTSASGSSLLVGGQSVCLLDGTNCPAGSSMWTEQAATNTVVLTTPTRELMLGGDTTSTAGFIWNPTGAWSGTSTLYIGATTNTNILVGTSTYGGGLDPNFSLSGHDLFVQGKIGSVGGLYSATSVVVGASTFYNEGTIVKTTPGDFSLALNNAGSSFTVSAGGASTPTFTVASSGNVGIGIADPTSALSVKGGISMQGAVQNLITTSTAISVASSTSITTPNRTRIVGNYGYVADGSGSLKILDLTNPSSAVLLSSVTIPASGTPADLAIQGSYAFVLDSFNGNLDVINIANPRNPLFVTSLALEPQPMSIAISGKYAYVTDNGTNNLQVIDISTPTSPTVVNLISSVGAKIAGLSIVGTHAYVGSFNGLTVVDISNPLAGYVSGTSTGTFKDQQVAVLGRYAYVGYANGIDVFDVSSSTDPILKNQIGISGMPLEIAVQDRTLYAVTDSGNLIVVDITDPLTAAVHGVSSQVIQTVRVNATGRLNGVAIKGRYAYIGDIIAGKLDVVSLGGFETNALTAGNANIGQLDVGLDAFVGNELRVGGGLTVRGQTVCLLDGTNCPTVVSTPATASVVGAATDVSMTSPQEVATFNGTAYVTDPVTKNLHIFDITKPTAPLLETALFMSTMLPSAVVTDGRYAYVSGAATTPVNGKICTVDVARPFSVSIKGCVNVGGAEAVPQRLALSGNYLYATVDGTTSGDGVQVFDVSSSTAPVLIGSWTPGSGHSFKGIDVLGNYVYAVDNTTHTIYVVDFTDPRTPHLSSSFVTPATGATGLAVQGNYAYVVQQGVSASTRELSVVDITDPTFLVTVSSTLIGAGGQYVKVSGRYAYVTNSTDGTVSIIDIENPFNPSYVGTVTVGANAQGMSLYGRYLYVANYTAGSISIVDIGGVNTAGLTADSAEIGSMHVLTNGNIGSSLFVGDGVTVGHGGLVSSGALHVESPATSTFEGAASVKGDFYVGTSTYGGGLPKGFSPSGNDLFVQNNIGTLGGIYSATSVAVGTGLSTYFGDSKILQTGLGDFSFMLRNLFSSFQFYPGAMGTPAFTIAASGDVGIGVTSPGAALDVKGNIQDILQTNQSISTVGNISASGTLAQVKDVALSGSYAYAVVTTLSGSFLEVYDVTSPTAPVYIGAYTFPTTASFTPSQIHISGNRAYVSFQQTVGVTYSSFEAFDISDPSHLKVVASTVTTVSGAIKEFALSGEYVYLLTASELGIYRLDSQDSINLIGTPLTFVNATGLSVSQKLVYVSTNTALNIVDVSDPVHPYSRSTFSVGTTNVAVRVSGRYAYVLDSTTPALRIVDVSDLTAPTSTATYTTNVSSPNSLDVVGRYAYLAQGSLGSGSVEIVDLVNPAAPVHVASISSTGTTFVHLFGRYAYAGNGSTIALLDITGADVNGLSANSASISRLQVSGDAAFGSSAFINGGLSVGDGGILSLGSLAVSATNTTSTFAYGVSALNGTFTNMLQVNGVSVCLKDGTNCPAQALAVWQDSDLTNITSLTTSTRELMLGGNTTSTAGFIWNPNSTSTLTLGSSARTNLLVNNGTVGIGVASATAALDVEGNVQNILHGGQTLTTVNTVTGLTGASGVAVQGKYAYVVQDAGTSFSILDISNPANAVTVTSTNGGNSLFSVAVAGRYAYVTDITTNTVHIYDVSNAHVPTLVSTVTVGTRPTDIVVSGRYAYVANYFGDSLSIIDVSSSTAPFVAKTLSLAVGSNPYAVAVAGGYAYTANYQNNTMSVIDITDPLSPTVASTTLVAAHPTGVSVQGRYAYLASSNGGTALTGAVQIIDISNPASPSIVGIADVGATAQQIVVAGRYAYTPDYAGGTMSVVDVSSSTAPIRVATAAVGSHSLSVALSGQYAYVANATGNSVSVVDLGGIETNALTAHNAQIGSLQVLSNGVVSNDFSVMGALNVGEGGILSQGAVSIFASSTAGTALSIANAASNTEAVLTVRGACDNTAGVKLFQILNRNNFGFSFNCDGNAYSHAAFNAGGADFAEYFVTTGTLPLPGDVVMLGATSSSVALSAGASRDRILGVVSTQPGFVGNLGVKGGSAVVVGLLGQIPTHVDASAAPIAAGDYLMAGDHGVAVKAQGPGMIIGRALDSLASGTSTLMAYVDPQWWAGDLFVATSTGTEQVRNITAVSLSGASASTTLMNSPAYSFEGSAWDPDTNTAISSRFSLFTAPQSTSTALFTIANATGTPVLTISDLGNTTVSGDLTVDGRLFLSSKSMHTGSTSTYLFVDDTAPSSTFISTNADGFQTLSTYDYAERYSSHDDLVPGDVVTVDASGLNLVRRTTSTNDAVLGIVSTRPGFVTGAYATGTYPIALAGRVPTRVSTKNGAIHVGDALMASDIPGVAVKAVGAGNTVGVALESYDAPEEGLISVFVKVGWQAGSFLGTEMTTSTPATSSVTASTSARSGLAKVYAGSTSVKVTFPTINAFPIVQATPYGEAKGGYWFTGVSDTGFTITLAAAPTFDLLFAWTVQPSANGSTIYYSDNTSALYDSLTGNAIPTATTATTTEPIVTSTSTSSTASAVSATTSTSSTSVLPVTTTTSSTSATTSTTL